MASEKFIKNSEKWEDLGGGVSRQFLGWDNQIMMVKVKFEKGAIGSTHQHFHTQATYVAKGKFEFTIDGQTKIVEEGEGVYIAPNLPHGTICLEDGILIDVFSPVREDFLDGSQVSYFGKK
ncbi:cupin domain-containing protein [Tenuifilum thalassicum]|uniref:Cupin domain-containing protein n=1 Tax=Tenuifilum thalassicum TaxID=2590900 RepID=A0A7D4CG03_9BACT|nr:cupin domain-containing protein [Tenuifilum thalassicum]QKG79466.1 cupin domain-containing protein [Tenuifilum thalassicum]